MSASTYIAIIGTPKRMATRDLQDLAEKGIFVPASGRAVLSSLKRKVARTIKTSKF